MTITEREYKDWLSLVDELKKLGIDINEQNGLHKAIGQWADSYRLLNKDIEIN